MKGFLNPFGGFLFFPLVEEDACSFNCCGLEAGSGEQNLGIFLVDDLSAISSTYS